MALLRQYRLGLKVNGSFLDVDFGTGANQVLRGSLLPGPYTIDTTGATTGEALIFNGTEYMPGVPLGGSSNVILPAAACTMACAVRDVVYLSGAATFAQGNATDATKSPVVGFVQSKPTSTTAQIQTAGLLAGFTGLTPGVRYYVGTTAGTITATPPASTGNVVQIVGTAYDTATMIVGVDLNYVVL